ncbi:MAG: hypothetical protein KC910_21220 [Candidatus Eremiobacteraeota bacterium]|nr:hypothetical protein [Candidatus Eremiobacteraeota bacterium]
MALKDVGKSTPAVEVIRRILDDHGKAMSVEELTVNMINSWGRDFPNTPYESIPLIYKLATNVLHCDVSFEDIGGETPIIEREEGAEDKVPLSPALGPNDLNLIVDKLRLVKVSLPGDGDGKKKKK